MVEIITKISGTNELKDGRRTIECSIQLSTGPHAKGTCDSL
jgi:hypothetical protein